MPQQVINPPSVEDYNAPIFSGVPERGDNWKTLIDKCNSNFNEIYQGTTNLPITQVTGMLGYFMPQEFGSLGPTLDTTNETDYRDNYSYIVAAIEAANSANGGIVYLSPGLWIISQPLVIPYDNIFIVGAGKWVNFGINPVPGTTFGTRIRLDSNLVQTAVKFEAATLRNLFGGGMTNLNIDGGNFDGAHGGTNILQLHATIGTRLLGVKLDRAGSGGYGLRLDGRNNLNCGGNLIMDLEVVCQGSGQSALGMNVDATNDATGGGCSRNVIIRADLFWAGDTANSHGIAFGFADNNLLQEVCTQPNGGNPNPTGKGLHFIPQIIRPEFPHENLFINCPIIGGVDGTAGRNGNWFIPYPTSDGEGGLPANCYSITYDGYVHGHASLESIIDITAPPYSAVNDDTADATAAFQAAIDDLQADVGGLIFAPAGIYKITSPLTIANGNKTVVIRGSGLSTVFDARFADTTVFDVQAYFSEISDLLILAKGCDSASASFGASFPAINIRNNGVGAKVQRCYIVGGSTNVSVSTQDVYLVDLQCGAVHGPALIDITSGGQCWGLRLKLDNGWPVSGPNPGTSISARANTTHYNVGDIATLSGYYIQCSVAGTTAGSPPALQNYNVNITDGGATWRLACPTTMDTMHIGTGTNEVHITQCDFSSACRYGLNVAGGGNNFVHQCVFGQNVVGSVYANGGQKLDLTNNEIYGGVVSGSFCVKVDTGWDSDLRITSNDIGAPDYGVFLNAGANAIITGNYFANCTTAGVHVAAGISDFIVNGNTFTGCLVGVNVAAGASNHYNIVNNLVHNSTSGVVDNGAGVNKTVSGNN